MAITLDGSRIVSASSDRTLRVWDLESARRLQMFEGHEEGVSAVAILPDGRHIVSGHVQPAHTYNFAILAFLGYQFAPRYKDIRGKMGTLYGFKHPSQYDKESLLSSA